MSALKVKINHVDWCWCPRQPQGRIPSSRFPPFRDISSSSSVLGVIPGSGREGSALTTHRLRAALESPGSVPGIHEPPAPSPRSSRGQGQLSKQRDTCAGKARATRDILGSRGSSLNLPFSFDLHPSSLCSSALPRVCFPPLLSRGGSDLCSTLELLLGAFKGI